MVSEQEAQYSFGRHSLTHKFTPNLPFILYWTAGGRALTYESIREIDSIKRDSFLDLEISGVKSIYDPVMLYFGDKTELKISKHVDTHSEYTLFTYLSNTRYYLTRGIRYRTTDYNFNYFLALTSVKNKDIIKGDR